MICGIEKDATIEDQPDVELMWLNSQLFCFEKQADVVLM
jgi:hypothetical protein